MRKRSPATTRPKLAPTFALATNTRDPRDSEIGRGGERDDGEARRRRQLRRVQWCYGVHLTRAHLAVPSIEAIAAAKGNGDDHGGARPRHGRLRRGYDVSALMAHSTSFSVTHSSKHKGEKGWKGRGGSWPRGAPTPARSRHGGGGRNGDYALTKPQSTRLNGGGGRGDHGEARSKRADAFLQWRACKAMATATLGRKWRSYGGFGAARGEGERMRWSRRVRRAGAGLLLELRRATWRLR